MTRQLRDIAERKFQTASKLMQKGLQSEALECIQIAEEISMKLKDEDFLLSILTMKGELNQTTESYEDALKTYTSVIRKTEKNLNNDPKNKFYLDIIKYNILKIGDLGFITSKNGQLLLSRSCCELNLEISQKMYNLDPEDEVNCRNLGHSLLNFGSLLADMGRFDESKTKSEEALNIYKELHRKYPHKLIYQSSIGTIIGNLGNVLKSLGLFDVAMSSYEESLCIRENLLKKNPENEEYQSSVAFALNNLGTLLSEMGRNEDAKNRYEESLYIREKLIEKHPDNLSYKYNAGCTYNHLASLFLTIGCYEEAKEKYNKSYAVFEELLKNDPKNTLYLFYTASMLLNQGPLVLLNAQDIEGAKKCLEMACEICEDLLEDDPDNVLYQAYLGQMYNVFAEFVYVMEKEEQEKVEEAKKLFENVLKIYNEPMQYMTVIQKSHSIIRLIELNIELADRESNSYRQIEYLKNSYQICKDYHEFFSKYELKHEKNLVMEAGLSSYVDYIIKNIRWERDPKKRVIGYEKAIKTIEEVGKINEDEEILKVISSTVSYLKGRKLVNEALDSLQPNLELIKLAINHFKSAQNSYKEASACYCIHTGLLKILGNKNIFEEKDGLKAKELINQVIVEILPKNIDPSVKTAFEEISKIFDDKDIKSRKKHLDNLDEKIRAIESKAIETLFGHVLKKLRNYIDEPFSPNLFYNNWKLKITFDAEKIKGKLIVRTENIILFNRTLNNEEIEDNSIEIDYIDKKYVPNGKDTIIFEIPHEKQVIREVNYSETISKNKKAHIFSHNCCNNVSTSSNLRIAVVQLKYDVYSEDNAVRILENEAYNQKVMSILEVVRDRADIILFPEFSIPFDYLEKIQRYSNESGIIVLAGTHYVTEENLEKYENLFVTEFTEKDLRKNICPIVIPNSKIIHSEKMFGAEEERDLFFNKGMRQGKLNHILKLKDNLNIGIMICFEYLNDELRNRLISTCDVILVPQTNPNPQRFYYTAKNDLNNPLCSGNKAYIMANGVFRIGKMENDQFVPKEKVILGGTSGILLTLNKESNKVQDEGIIYEKNNMKEQFVLISTVNSQFSASRDLQTAHKPIKTELIHIFQEDEIRLSKKENAEEFLTFIKKINRCNERAELKNLIERNNSLIEEYSPLMNEHLKTLSNLDFNEIKDRCCFILIS
jgi:tetratricopeptide (TPR) repeat protein/predicted amidohydrolase